MKDKEGKNREGVSQREGGREGENIRSGGISVGSVQGEGRQGGR